MLGVPQEQAVLRLDEGDDVIALAKQLQRTLEGPQDLLIRGEVVGIAKSFSGDWYQLGVEHPLIDPFGATMSLVAVVRGQRALEDRFELVSRLWRGQVSHKRSPMEDGLARDTQGTDRRRTFNEICYRAPAPPH